MPRKMFVNLPVADLQKSIAFFADLGFSFNPQFSDDNATCMVIGAESYVMLLVRDFFQGFTDKRVADASAETEVLVCLSADSREEVDDLCERALAAGAQPSREPMDEGFMYGRSFADLDGHIWEIMWMDPAAITP